VSVTFAGSPDRIEADLVPKAGYELDVYRISGLPRRAGSALLHALALAARAPLACLRILRRRRPHVVVGGGGYVAGPMVAAAALLRIPSALLEADAHLGLANRLAAPFAQRDRPTHGSRAGGSASRARDPSCSSSAGARDRAS
jgi:UDP-N-acetylglucosamine--N-acetylmuramyl-(pentapeptide) pyrophosphoryl-undecaprenol N-acetylglucosamine transferase